MDAVILAAGEGRKLRPLTAVMPKVMIPVGNKPIIEYVVEALVKNDVRDMTIVVGYFGEKIKRYLGDGRNFGAHIRYVRQKKQLGTAHALYQAMGLKDFIVVPGDNIVGVECITAIKNTPPGTILSVRSNTGSKYGVVERTRGGVKIVEKPVGVESSAIFTGIAHLDSSVFDAITRAMREEIFSLPEVLSSFVGIDAVYGDCMWKDAMYPWDLHTLNSYVLGSQSRMLSGKIERATVVGNVVLHRGARIGAGTYIKGPAVIGRNAEIGPNSVIMPDTSIGAGVKIGALSYIENSIIMEGALIDAGVYIKDSVIGPGAKLHPRSTLTSGDFERVLHGEVYRGSGGSIVGPRAEIGSMSVIAPGLLVGADSWIAPMKTIVNDVDNEEKVR